MSLLYLELLSMSLELLMLPELLMPPEPCVRMGGRGFGMRERQRFEKDEGDINERGAEI